MFIMQIIFTKNQKSILKIQSYKEPRDYGFLIFYCIFFMRLDVLEYSDFCFFDCDLDDEKEVTGT